MAEIQNQCQCTVPLAEVLGPGLTTDAAAAWAASEGVELRRSWDGRLALAVDDARAVHAKASAAAEAARLRNEAKTAALVASLAPVPPGKPVPPELDGVSALDWMKAEEWDERLDAADDRYRDYTSADDVYYPINPGQG